MEDKLSEVLDNILGLLLLEGSYEIEESDEAWNVSIETKDAGRLIGARGESLEGLQLLVNQIMSRKVEEGQPAPSARGERSRTGVEGFKRVLLDVEGWRKQKEEELKRRAEEWGKQVLEEGKDMDLEPQSAWQRRVVHMVVGEMKGLETESVGEGRDRHIVIRPTSLVKLKAQKPARPAGGSNVKNKKA